MRDGASNIGNTGIELVQPLDEKTIYDEFLKKHGEGFQHLAYKINNYEETMEKFNKLGVKVSQTGNWEGKLIFVYLDSDEQLKHCAEFFKTYPNTSLPDPLEVYPGS